MNWLEKWSDNLNKYIKEEIIKVKQLPTVINLQPDKQDQLVLSLLLEQAATLAADKQISRQNFIANAVYFFEQMENKRNLNDKKENNTPKEGKVLQFIPKTKR